MASSLDYPSSKSLPFPYERPYPQQLDFMDALLSGLRDGQKVLMLESPTGTGKSLSLASSAIAWLRYQEQHDLSALKQNQSESEIESEKGKSQHDNNKSNNKQSNNNNNDDDDDWLKNWKSTDQIQREFDEKAVRERAQTARDRLHHQITHLRKKLADVPPDRLRERRENLARSAVTSAKMKERRRNKKKRFKRNNKPKFGSKQQAVSESQDFCVREYKSDDEKETYADCHSDDDGHDHDNGQNTQVTQDASHLLDGTNLDGSSALHGSLTVGNVTPGSGVRKIIYAARTHSQLSQFVSELRRVAPDVRVVALGGRQTLCGNEQVNRKGRSEHTISENCLDLQKDKSKTCPLMVSKEALATLGLHLIIQPSDIEDAAKLGAASHTCAYYASRKSIVPAEVVVMPYSMLLSKQARSAIGLSLKEALVLIDESHNLPETLRGLHSSRLSLPVAQTALAQLVAYTKKYATRLAGRNLFYIGQIRKSLTAFIQYLQREDPSAKERAMVSSGELLMELNLDNVNIFKILRYLDHSRLAQKVLGFSSNKEIGELQQEAGLSKHISALSIVQTFLEKLTASSKEGKIVTDWPKSVLDGRSSSPQHPTLRYVLLNPAAHFEDVVNEAKSVALVGGTLRPFGHVAAELLPKEYQNLGATADSHVATPRNEVDAVSTIFTSPLLKAFTCDHVVPSRNVCLETVGMGPTKQKLDFRHKTRSSLAVMDELGRVISKLSEQVPNGMVVFLPSYAYESQLVRRWKSTKTWDSLSNVKKLFREPKSSQQVESILGAYNRGAHQKGGALLLSVVGGKMSEGINFANEMARCVVVVGLPYPDITDPELQEKMSTMDKGRGGISGNAYYHNLCMRAVNQSIGRAIRHANDYASILLVDERYRSDGRVWKALPDWLKRGSSSGIGREGSFEVTLSRLGHFYGSQGRGALVGVVSQ